MEWHVLNLLHFSFTHTKSKTSMMSKNFPKVISMHLLNFIVEFIQYYYFFSVYHDSLCENGVKDYPFNDFMSDVQIAISEQVLRLIKMVNDMKPSSLQKMFGVMSGEEKAKDLIDIFERGLLIRPVLVLTSLYVKDKENFLIVK